MSCGCRPGYRMTQSEASLFRYRGDGWEEVVPEVPLCDQPVNFFPDYASGPAAVVATDGAIWTMTGEGLARYVDDSPQVITVGARGCVAFPGPDNGVWLRSDPGFVLATPQGAGSAVPLPSDLAAPDVCSWAAGPDGTVLVSTPAEEAITSDERATCSAAASGSGTGHRGGPSTRRIHKCRCGAFWSPTTALLGPSRGDTLSRYDDQEWTTIDPDIGYALAFRAAPAGKACVLFETDSPVPWGTISCYDSAGKIARPATTIEVFDFSVAPDGAIWGARDQIVRLAEQLPTR